MIDFDRGRRRPALRAVDGLSLGVDCRQTVGVVGESGSGKTTLGRAILGLVRVTSGSITFAGTDITHAGARERRRLSRDLQVVFQDPFSSLNPTRTIGETLSEGLRLQRGMSRGAVGLKVAEMLERVGLPDDATSRYPTGFSGGQRQRIAIARALIMRPRLVICDEPVSALDLSVQAQVLNLLRELQEELGVAYIFIAHDLDVVRHLSERIIVMYRGRVMEEGEAESLYNNPAHPYTQALLAAAPVPDPVLQAQRRAARKSRIKATGSDRTSSACPFAPRCPHSVEQCWSDQPRLEPTEAPSRVACHRWREIRSAGTQLPKQISV